MLLAFRFISVVILATCLVIANAQPQKCASIKQREKKMQQDPSLKLNQIETEKTIQEWLAKNSQLKLRQQVITIPVVVHVIWNRTSHNITEAQILSQIEVLNRDFRKLNNDVLKSPHPFAGRAADAQIEFCLATVDPRGAPTTGITRTRTPVEIWGEDIYDDIMSTARGGQDNWDPTRYLNLYVANLDEETLGFASFPDELKDAPELDGVVIKPEVFGTKGIAGSGGYDVNNGGRTATHEIGHWLDLWHIWGDDDCGDDFVGDTEAAEEANYDCPDFPHRAMNDCGTGVNGEMFMNYMDYVDDDCMNMFTKGQALRMLAALNGPRAGLLNAQGCQKTVSVQKTDPGKNILIYPNPNPGVFTIVTSSLTDKIRTIKIQNSMGRTVFEQDPLPASFINLEVTAQLPPGLYLLQIQMTNHSIYTKKLFITN